MSSRGRTSGRPGRERARPDAGRTARTAPAPPDIGPRRTRLRELVEPVVRSAGYDLEDMSVSRTGRRYVVRVIVDGDSGVSLDAVADLSRAVSTALDSAEADGGELIPGEYLLEVSSPGVDRPLTLPRHWRRNVGRLVAVAAAGQRVTGRVTAADDSGVVLDVDGTAREVGYADLGAGRVQIEFSRVEEIDEDDLAAFDDPDGKHSDGEHSDGEADEADEAEDGGDSDSDAEGEEDER